LGWVWVRLSWVKPVLGLELEAIRFGKTMSRKGKLSLWAVLPGKKLKFLLSVQILLVILFLHPFQSL
jgi:hypothetical protein